MTPFYLRPAVLLLALLTCATQQLQAQSTDSLSITVEHTPILKTDTVAEVRVFLTGGVPFTGYQVGLNWEDSEITFEDVVFSDGIASLENEFSTPEPGQFRALGFNFSNNSVVLPEDSLLMTLRFRVGSGFSGSTPVYTDAAIPTEIVFQDNSVAELTIRQGFISFGAPVIYTDFSTPYLRPDAPDQFCVDLNATEAYAIAGFELDLAWDSETFPLVDVLTTGDNAFRLSAEEISFSADQFVLTRSVESGIRFPAVLSPATIVSLCFTTDDEDAVSDLSFGGDRAATTVFGVSPTGQIITVEESELAPGSLSEPEPNGLFSAPAALPALDVFPNPARDVLQLRGLATTTSFRVSLWNEVGQLVLRKDTNDPVLFVNDLPAGSYTLGVVQNDKRWLNRIIITH